MGVRHYRMALTTTGLLHIGNGASYGKKDYFVAGDQTVAVLDAKRFFARLDAEEQVDYLRFLETDSRSSLQDFLGTHSHAAAQARSCVAYQAQMNLAKARRGSYQFFEVAQFVKDSYGLPYVPGSSLKGMLRTALLVQLIRQDRGRYLQLFDAALARSRDRRKACRAIERAAFWRDVPAGCASDKARDIMRCISVSDSEPLSTNDLVFAKKYDKFSRGDSASHKLAMGKISKESDYRDGNALNIYRECLRPGTRIVCTLDVDEAIDSFLSGLALDAEGLTSILSSSFELYQHCFLDRFDLSGIKGVAGDGGGGAPDDGRCQYIIQAGPLAGMRCRNRSVDGTGFCSTHADQARPATSSVPCLLGGGVDFDSKTVMNALLEDDPARVYEISRILDAQFPTRIAPGMHAGLAADVRDAGFEPRQMEARYDRRSGRLMKGKDDHRHWKDAELGVSPHTLKLGIIGQDKYLMGRCTLSIEEA